MKKEADVLINLSLTRLMTFKFIISGSVLIFVQSSVRELSNHSCQVTKDDLLYVTLHGTMKRLGIKNFMYSYTSQANCKIYKSTVKLDLS